MWRVIQWILDVLYGKPLAECREERTRQAKEIEALKLALAESSKVPSASDYVELADAEVFTPWLNLKLKKYTLTYADLVYYSFPKEQWVELLGEIQPVLIKCIGEWLPEISDCDNFSLSMYHFVSKSFMNAGYEKQGSFMIVWSQKHAYNAFADTDGKIWIYEPQTNKVIGEIDDVLDEIYESDKVWFPGEVRLGNIGES